MTSGELRFGHPYPPGPEQERVCWGAQSAIPSGHRSAGYRATSAAARPRHRRVPLQTSAENTGVGRTESHGRVQPAAGVPPPAPGRGKLRREVGRRKAASGAVILQQKRGCLRTLTEFGAATQRLCFQQREKLPLFFGDAVESQR